MNGDAACSGKLSSMSPYMNRKLTKNPKHI